MTKFASSIAARSTVHVNRTINVQVDLAEVIAALPRDLTTQDQVTLTLNIPDQRSRTITLTHKQVQDIVESRASLGY